jgi:xanthine dehydrogenase YagR molybdenum-binding subunit
MNVVGQPVTRVDGFDKVTGKAKYAADFDASKIAYAWLVQSTVGKGRIASIETSRATALPGVLMVMTHENAPKLPASAQEADPPGERALSLLQDDVVRYNGEPIAVVVANSLEQARHGAELVAVAYAAEAPTTDFNRAQASAYTPEKLTQGKPDSTRGETDSAFASAAVKHEATYTTPMESHNPMEPHATMAVWDGDRLTVYDSTQGVSGTQKAIAKKLGLEPEKVHVISPYVGGGFGCKGSAWSHVVLAAMAARQLRRPVRLALDRTQMFGPVGYRPTTHQRIALGADRDGKLVAIKHDVISPTSTFEDWTESSAVVTRMLYACPNVRTSHKLVKLNLGTPTFQRAPGEATGTYALEVAMDELAVALSLDPIELRLRNHADKEPESGKAFSSKKLHECYADAAKGFGWSRRTPQPRSMRDGDKLIGLGMATATYPANRMPTKARVRLNPDGTALVQCGTQDIGTGTYTILAQVASDALGLGIDRIKVEIGDSTLPTAPVSGGSMSAASATPAVQAAAQQARDRLIAMSVADDASPLHGMAASDVETNDGWVQGKSETNKREPFAAVLARAGGKPIEGNAEAKPSDETKKQYSTHSFGAVFAEVEVDEPLGQVRVRRVVATYDVGTILNAKTARSQFIGGIVWGIGMALMEHTLVDAPTGRVLNNNLAQYHVPVNADIMDIDVTWVEDNDQVFNPLGARGIGEIGITGVAAAIANAIYHATGTRLRDLPITPDVILRA